MAFTCAFFSSQHVTATLVASRLHSVTVPLGSASAMKGWKGCTVTSAPGATQASSLTVCRATSALPSGMWSSASWLIGPSSSWTGLTPSKSLESLVHTSRRSTCWRRSSLKSKPSSLKIQQLSPWRTLGISLRKQSEYSYSYMDKSVVGRSGSSSELGFMWVTDVPMLGWGHSGFSGWLRVLWPLGCWTTLPCSALAVSTHPTGQKPGSRNLVGQAGTVQLPVLGWVVLLPLLSRQLITTEPLMLALCCPRAKDKHCYYVREWRGGEIKFLDFPCSWWVGNFSLFLHSEHVLGKAPGLKQGLFPFFSE